MTTNIENVDSQCWQLKTSQMMTNRVRFKLSLSCLTQNNIGLEVLELLRPFSRVSLLNIFKEPVDQRENSSNRKSFSMTHNQNIKRFLGFGRVRMNISIKNLIRSSNFCSEICVSWWGKKAPATVIEPTTSVPEFSRFCITTRTALFLIAHKLWCLIVDLTLVFH